MADTVFEPEVKRSLARLQEMAGGSFPPMAFECKKTQEARLSFSQVKPHQIAGLREFERSGHAEKLRVTALKSQRFAEERPFDFLLAPKGVGYVLVNFRFTKRSPRRDIKKGTNKCFAVSIRRYVIAKAAAEAEGKASLSYDWFVENGIECPRLRVKHADGKTDSCWDLQGLLMQQTGVVDVREDG